MSTLLHHKRRFHASGDGSPKPKCSPGKIQFLSLEDIRRKRQRFTMGGMESDSSKRISFDVKSTPPPSAGKTLRQPLTSIKRSRSGNAMETEEEQTSKRLRCLDGSKNENLKKNDSNPFIADVKVNWKGAPSKASNKKKKYYTEEQVKKIVQTALTDQEEKLREQYNKILNDRLAEQFENFTSFNKDYVYRQMNRKACSYVS
mmetsp:Transcript_6597/g.10887  ORF Transcript_6597/g.10887 Transcript_6597/m.10887 type:complete len:202 (+) Transcript_6597:132-737(+)|eukprot:jgi/Bigna1/91188/estExt_fgenesh1_pg.C_920024